MQEESAQASSGGPGRFVVMGVSGCGKSAIGLRMAQRLDIAFVEGDQHHSPQSIAKMAAGVPLDDADRHEWLLTLQRLIGRATRRNEGLVLTCSALKRRYRDILRGGDPALVFVHLHGEPALIAERMNQRTGHFMPAALLESQLRDLEPLAADERGIQVDIAAGLDEVVDQIMQKILRI